MHTAASRPEQLAPLEWPLCIDGRMIDKGTSGVANYSNTLYCTLSDYGLKPLLLGDGGARERRTRLRKWAKAIRPGARSLHFDGADLAAPDIFTEAWVHFSLFGRLVELNAPGPPGIMHWTYPLPLRVRGWRNIYTVHDAIPLKRPDLTNISLRRHRRLLARIIERADRIVTGSETARADIASATGCSPALVANVSQAIDVANPSGAPLPFGLQKDRYFLFSGSIETRKNVERLIEAHRESGTDLPLVLIGTPGMGGDRAVKLAASLPDVRLISPQPRPIILNILRSAKAFLFPSLAEGFGLPIAEAMAFGVPVLTSRGGATEETAGGAACLIDPLDVEEMARAIRRLADDVAWHDELRKAGLKRSQAFQAAPYAQRLRALYVDVAKR